MNDTRYRAAAFQSVKGREGNRIVTRLATGERIVMQEAVHALLNGLLGFETLATHERVMAQHAGIAKERDPAIRAALENLRRQGLLISEDEFFAATLPAGASPDVVPISTICIPTRENSSTLDHCIASYTAHAQKFGRPVRFIVAGGNQFDKHAIAAALSGCDPEIVRFALFGEAPGLPTGVARNTGANRNALLLACAGQRFLSVDDDTVCTLTCSPNAVPEFAVKSPATPKEHWFAPDLPCGSDDGSKADDIDLLLEMSRALGPAVRRRDALASIEFAHSTLATLVGGNACARLALAGLHGDAATDSPDGWLRTSGATRERLVESESRYKRAMSSRQVLSVAPCETLSDTTELMGYCVAFDEGVLPPFPPLGRDQDGVFGVWMRAADPHSFTTHMPFAITHSPAEERAFAPDLIADPVRGVSLCEVLRMAFDGLEKSAPDGGVATRLIWFGARLSEIATDLRAFLTERRLALISRNIEIVEAGLASYGSRPAWWARDVQSYIRGLERAMSAPDILRYAEPGAQIMPNDPVSLYRTYVDYCGRLLREWPAMLASANVHLRKSKTLQ